AFAQGRGAEEGGAVQLARHDLQMPVDEGGELAHLGRGKCIGRQQRRLGPGVLDPLQQRLAFAQRTLRRRDERNLAQRRRTQDRLVGAMRGGKCFGEGHALFEQRKLDLVVVVGYWRAVKCQHCLSTGNSKYRTQKTQKYAKDAKKFKLILVSLLRLLRNLCALCVRQSDVHLARLSGCQPANFGWCRSTTGPSKSHAMHLPTWYGGLSLSGSGMPACRRRRCWYAGMVW